MTIDNATHSGTAHVALEGHLVIIGFGAIGRGLLPLVDRHIGVDKSRFFVIDPDPTHSHILEEYGVQYVQAAVTADNYRDVLLPLLNTAEQSMCVNIAIDVSSIELMRLCRETNSLYVDASVEPWKGYYLDQNLTPSERSVYALRETMLAEKPAAAGGVTAVSCCGANPGLVSWLVKQALLNLAGDLHLEYKEPHTRMEWASLMHRCGVKGIHIAERDTQLANFPKPMDAFVNTWSADGLICESLQPAELGWGTHENWLPPDAHQHDFGCQSAIYLMRPGGNTRVRTWCPTPGAQFGFLVPHNEAISISDYFSISEGGKTTYRPTCHYAYHPCNHAVLSLNELFGREGIAQPTYIQLEAEDIVEGADELGVLLYGHAKNAYWFGSHLTIEQAVRNAPFQNATTMQVSSGVLAGMVWAIENPHAGLVEPEEMDFRRCLEVQAPYLGRIFGEYTDWTPIDGRQSFFPEDIDESDPWQFRNVLVQA